MNTSIEVVTEAKETALLTVHDAKLGLNMVATTADDQIELMIKWASGEIAKLCNRVLAQETVIETILELEARRIYLSHYPVKTITEVSENGTILSPGVDYNLDVREGKLTRAGGALWALPTVIKYTGGYDLPQKAPSALASAAMLKTREAYHAAIRGDATIRMITHKQSRIMFFDPNAAAAKAAGTGGSGGTAATRAIMDLVRHYIRYEV
jgi:hypothetical protein